MRAQRIVGEPAARLVWRPGQHWRLAQSRTGAQRPQRASQQTEPTLQVLMPHSWLTGVVGPPSQRAWLQVAPGAAQMPQLALQQTWPTLQVFAPHAALLGEAS